jgi:rod shape-determining protein MreD
VSAAGALQSFDRAVCRLVPFMTALAAVLVDLLPLPSAAPLALAPSASLCVLYYWTVHRPDRLGAVEVFLIGLLLDAGGGMPLGLTALSLLAVRGILLPGQRFLPAQPFAAIWACFVLVAAAFAAVRWGFASLWWGRLLPTAPLLIETVLTVAAYPAVGLLLGKLRPQRSGTAHAARG